jgi:hypothetical protein
MLMSHFENNWPSDLDGIIGSAGNYVFFVTLSHAKNSICNSIISVFQLVDQVFCLN